MKISDPIKTSAFAIFDSKSEKFDSSLSSSIRYPFSSMPIGPFSLFYKTKNV